MYFVKAQAGVHQPNMPISIDLLLSIYTTCFMSISPRYCAHSPVPQDASIAVDTLIPSALLEWAGSEGNDVVREYMQSKRKIVKTEMPFDKILARFTKDNPAARCVCVCVCV